SPYVLAYFAAIGLQFATGRLWANLLLSATLGHLLYCLFVLHHDCMHKSAFQNDRFNRMMGRFYALAFTMTFTTNRETHARHHAHTADPDQDPDEYYFSAGMKDIWPRIWRYYEWYTRISLTKYGTKVRLTVLAEQMANILLWLVVHVVVISQGLGVKMLFIFWLPIAFVAFVINPITRGYEHAPITLYPQGDPRRRDMSKNAITVNNPVFGWLCANITFHVEHHSVPRCPFYNLQKLHHLFQEERMQYLVAPFPLYRIWKGRKMLQGMTTNADPIYDPALSGTGRQNFEAATV
ncbi:MAG: beta-carotene hydroxylase, partial [Hyphomicrobiales bacterium]|nr:beta-carotene hydroxylase [Hyphomicrobiales bacterium]